MTRLTKSDIEQALLSGKSVHWTEALGKAGRIQLETAKQRRLYDYVKKSKIRDAKGLTPTFIDGLASVYVANGDPAADNIQQTINPSASGPWKIRKLRIEGFGGVNIWNGKPFELDLDTESLLLDGPNGSGKSSLNAAIIWALTGDRPRDQGEGSLEEAKSVYDATGKAAGSWPPVASYPPDISSLSTSPNVCVEIVFQNTLGKQASARRQFDGKICTYHIDPALQLPSTLIEAGLLMPARMPHLRLDEGKGKLTDAVQKLTGLDELIELGSFVQGICRINGDYLAYEKANLAASKSEFNKQIERARAALTPVAVVVPNLKPSDTDVKDGEMAGLGKQLNEKAAQLIATVSDDLASTLELSDPKTQRQIVIALDGAKKELEQGMSSLATWKLVESISASLTVQNRVALRKAVSDAQISLSTAVDYFKMQQADNRFRLKATGAHWHNENLEGAVEKCPLCDVTLKDKPALRRELDGLLSAMDTATRSLSDNVNAIMVTLEEAVPTDLRNRLATNSIGQPRKNIELEFKQRFVAAERYTSFLTKFGTLAEAACTKMPGVEIVDAAPNTAPLPETASVSQRLDRIEHLCRVAEWHEDQKELWADWWAKLTSIEPSEDENLSSHLRHLSTSLDEAEPFRIGADAMRLAWTEGRKAATIEKEQQKRQEIADDLAQLKQLGNLAEAQTRSAIIELSTRISTIHNSTYIVGRLKFQETTFEKKTGLVVRGQLGPDMRIDATLIANTSWLRSILWAFIHALREEAVEQIGADIFPVMLFDDPQQTFDSEHRTRWTEKIAFLQKSSGVQIILATHDEQFLSNLSLLEVTGRRALISRASEDTGHIVILEGDQLDRKWNATKIEQTPAAAKEFVSDVRVYVEGVLKLMLRGIDPSIPTALLGACREKINELHKGGIEPWNLTAFSNLVSVLEKTRKEIKWMENAHHSSNVITMDEANDVEKHWRKNLRPTIERCFQIIRDHRALHGGLTALHAFSPTAELPEGYKSKIRQFKLPLLGTAAALTEGRVADGCVDLEFDAIGTTDTEFSDHFVYRLIAPTIEPVARPGHLLLVRDHADATPQSLVVALHDDRILVRRLQIADNHSDVAVLTANAINPRLTAAPVVAKLSTLTMKKIVGVLYQSDKLFSKLSSKSEVVECGGESVISTILQEAKGLVAVRGHSAEPHALDKQFLIIADPVTPDHAISNLEGCPVIAEDSDGLRYFKRLRGENDLVILESLEIGGDFQPILLAKTKGLSKHVTRIWPVLGVLFEKP